MFMEFEKDEVRFLMAHDPGETTGMAWAEYDEKEVRITVIGHIPDGRVGYLAAFDGMQFGWPTNQDIVSEQWVERNIPGVDREPIYIEGVQYALWQDNVYYQTPDMKSLIPDEKLKELGIWREGQRHAMDAVIHLLIWLRNQGHKPTIQALSDEEGGGNGGQISMPAGGDGEPTEEQGEQADGAEGEQPTPEQQAAAKAMAQIAQAIQEHKEANAGAYGGNEEEFAHDLTIEVKGKRTERELNGAFTGFNTEQPTEQKSLWDQKF